MRPSKYFKHFPASIFLKKMTDELYMHRCIELAKKATGNTYPNPLVGAVIVHNNSIIGEGWHHKAGEPHAEINAIRSVQNPDLLAGSTIYVSLEPCSHYGKTPPCALKIIETGFQRVVIGTLDVHDKVNGKGKKMIEEAGIEVTTGVLEQQCRQLNKRFFTFQTQKRPYIILKWAASADGFLDKNQQPTSIGNSLTKQFVHQIRSEEHAILVGTRTALHDNPSLTTREITGRNPVRILIDFDLKVPNTYHIYNSEAKTLVFNSLKEEVTENIHFIKISRDYFLDQLMDQLFVHQIQSVLVEGGSYTLQQFIQNGLWDEAVIIENPTLHLGNGTLAPVFDPVAFTSKVFRDNTVRFYQNSIAF